MSYQYETIEKAIIYLSEHFKEQPNLEAITSSINLSPDHFQRMFTEWAGISPKKLRYSYQQSQFGEFILASTSIGICHLAF